MTKHATVPGSVALGVIVSGELMLMLDATVITVALPAISRDLGLAAVDRSWLVNAFMLAFGGLLLIGGRTGDVIGHRRAFAIGLSAFTLASVLAGLALTPGVMIIARAAQGAAAALAGPSSLALLTAAFEGQQRSKAFAIFSMVTGSAMTIGLALGAVLTATFGWRSVFLINVPVGLTAVLLTGLALPVVASRTRKLDAVSGILSVVGLSTLAYGLVTIATPEGGLLSWLSSITGFGVLAAFVARQRVASDPLLPLELLVDRVRGASFICMLLLPATTVAMQFFVTQYLQDVLGLSPLLVGASFLPMAVGVTALAMLSSRITARLGVRLTTAGGAGLIVVGAGLLALVGNASGYWFPILPAMVAFGAGIGMAVVPLNLAIMSSADPADHGIAGGILQTTQQVGGALGLAVLTAVYAVGAQHTNAPQDSSQGFVAGIVLAFQGAAVVATIAVAIAFTALPKLTASARDQAWAEPSS